MLNIFLCPFFGKNEVAFANDSDQCDVRSLLKSCERFKRRTNYDDGTHIPSTSDFKSPRSAPKDNIVNSGRITQVKSLVEFAREAIIEDLGNQRPQTSDHKAMIEKIKKVKFFALDSPEAKDAPQCQGQGLNASYSPFENSFLICPRFYNLPNETILGTIAHELAHAVDPCNSQFGLYSLNSDKLKQSRANNDGKDKDYKTISDFLDGINGDQVSLPFSQFTSRADAHEEFVRNGVLTTLAPGVPHQRYPYRSAYQCLVKSGFREISVSEKSKAVEKIVRTEKGNLSRSTPLEGKEEDAFRKEVTERLNRHPGCEKYSGRDGKIQVNESMADLLGARVLGKYLSDSSDKSDLAFKTLAFFGLENCSDNAGPMSSADYQNRLMASAGVHPLSLDRANKIWLKDPKIRAALGCSKDDNNCSKYIQDGASSGSAGKGAISREVVE